MGLHGTLNFVPNNRYRPNLDIVTDAQVTKILFDGRRAVGVRFFKNGAYHDVEARQEVVLSAGGTNSAQLLMLSGVGPVDHLRALGIPQLADLPVGDNLHDHITGFGLAFDVKDQNFVADNMLSTANLYDFFNSGVGPLAKFDVSETLASTARLTLISNSVICL